MDQRHRKRNKKYTFVFYYNENTINTNDSFIYFHSFLMTEMADGKGKTRRPAQLLILNRV